MEEEIIQLETAQLAKDKGFDINTTTHYYEGNLHFFLRDFYENDLHCFAPTQSLLQKWLREEHDIHLEITKSSTGWNWITRNLKSNPYRGKYEGIKYSNKTLNTYEKALEFGLQEILKLI